MQYNVANAQRLNYFKFAKSSPLMLSYLMAKRVASLALSLYIAIHAQLGLDLDWREAR